MESGGEGGMNPRVTVIAGEAQSIHHLVPRPEIPTQVTATPAAAATPAPVAASLQPGVGSVGTSEKKKRGRPRKYAPDGSLYMAVSTMPMSSSSAPPPNISFPPAKMTASGQPTAASEKSKKHRVGTQNLDDWISCSNGGSFTPHLITVNAGEDITMKILAVCQSGPQAICVISAFGTISSVTLRQRDPSGGTLTFEGRFDILSLSGCFAPVEAEGSVGRCGGLSISLSGADGRVLGGMIAGYLIAASPVQVVVGSFVPNGQPEPKPKKQKATNKVTGDAATSINMPCVELTKPPTQDPNISLAQNQNVPSSSTHQTQNWGMMPTGHDPRKSTTDINISWRGE